MATGLINNKFAVMDKYLTVGEKEKGYSFNYLKSLALTEINKQIADKEIEVKELRLNIAVMNISSISSIELIDKHSSKIALLVKLIKEHFVLQQHMVRLLVIEKE